MRQIGAGDTSCLLTIYVTTIYPTEVRINGKWIKVENQRMDARSQLLTPHWSLGTV